MNMFKLVAVTLGSPKADCANFGVCSLEPLSPETWATYRPPHLRAAKAWIALEDDGPLVLHFPKDGVLPLTRRHFFPSQGFRVDAPKALPEAMAAELGLESCVILPGLYPVEQNDDGDLVVRAAVHLRKTSETRYRILISKLLITNDL
jgi:hypothetical protein